MSSKTPTISSCSIPEDNQPVATGHPGNICVTTLFKTTVYPIVRFDTKDVSTALPERGDLNLMRIAGFQGRSDNMIKLRGINVYPTSIGAHLHGAPRRAWVSMSVVWIGKTTETR